eukprot:14850669-Heterocapsa_arctica.AAC.1
MAGAHAARLAMPAVVPQSNVPNVYFTSIPRWLQDLAHLVVHGEAIHQILPSSKNPLLGQIVHVLTPNLDHVDHGHLS